MPEEIEEIELRSDEVQDILSEVPNWMIRWGNTLFLSLILMFIAMANFMKYPDIVEANAKVTTSTPPAYILNQVSGPIQELKAQPEEIVEKNQFLAEIQNPSDKANVDLLQAELDKVKRFLSDKRSPQLNTELILGSAQTEYSNLVRVVNEYSTFLANPYYGVKIKYLQQQITQYQAMGGVEQQQNALNQVDLDLAKQRLETQRKLYEDELISLMELREAESQYKQLESNYKGTEKNTISNEITITELRRQINDLRNEQQQQENQLQNQIQQSLLNLENELINWDKNYVVRAPISGSLSFLKTLSNREFVNAGDTLFAVIPNNNQYVVELNIPRDGFGKVEVGQQVNLKLLNYPHQEFGYLNCTIERIGQIDKGNSYLAFASIESLETSYRHQIDYTPNMLAAADIITQDKSVLARLFEKLNGIQRK